MKTVAKILAIFILAGVAFVIAAYLQYNIPGRLIELEYPRSYLEMISTSAISAVGAGVVVAVPLVLMFGRDSWLAGLVVAAPMAARPGYDLINYFGQDESDIVVMSAVELLAYPVVIAGFAWFVGILYSRSASKSLEK